MSTDTPEPAESPKANVIDTADKLNLWIRTFSSDSQQLLNDKLAANTIYNRVASSAKDSWWIKREIARTMYEFGQVYQPVPATVNEILETYGARLAPYHFVHLSKTDATKISYTESWEHGVADRQQQISLGKYIKKYHPQVPEFAVKQAQECLNNLLVQAVVKFTTDEELIKRIYARAAPACMSKPSDHYKTAGLHPLAVYAKHDMLKLAYLEPVANSYTARALVVDEPDNKRYIRVYGDTLLTAQLDKLGYKRGTLKGLKLPLIKFMADQAEYALCPYLDDHAVGRQGTGVDQALLIKSDHMLVVSNGAAGSIQSNAEGRIRLPEWAPEQLADVPSDAVPTMNLVTNSLEYLPRESMYASGLVLGVHTFTRNTYGDRVHVHRFLRFRDLQDVDRLTRPLLEGGRFLFNPTAIEDWRIRIAVSPGAANIARGYVAMRAPGATAKWAQLNSGDYPRLSDGYHRHYVVSEIGNCVTCYNGTCTLVQDTILLTHGRWAGSRCSTNTAISDHLNPTHFYAGEEMDLVHHNDESSIDKYAPTEFVYRLDRVPDISFDIRVTPKPKAGMPPTGKQFYRTCGRHFAWSSNPIDDYIRDHYDQYVFRHREGDYAMYVDPDELDVDDEDKMLAFANRTTLVPASASKFKIEFTDQRTKEDAEFIQRHINEGSDAWLRNSGVRCLVEDDPLPASFIVALRYAYMKSIVDSLDLPEDNAETLIPQPETAVEPSVPVEQTECEA